MGNCVRQSPGYPLAGCLINWPNFQTNIMTASIKPPTVIPGSFLTGLLGAPIAHSASPAMHERAAEALNVRCHYQLIEVAGADRDGLRAILDGIRRLGF